MEKRPLEDIKTSTIEYVNLRIDQLKLKGVENASIIGGRIIVLLIATMFGSVALILGGIALSYYIGNLIGNIALGFLVSCGIFFVILLTLYLFRNKLFTGDLLRFLLRSDNYKQGDDSHSHIKSMDDLKREQMLLEHKIENKENDISRNYDDIKELFNPIYYFNAIIDKFVTIEMIIKGILNGYNMFKDMAAKKEEKRSEGEKSEK